MDKILDEATNNRGGHLFEKLIGGKYLGEIARLVLCQLQSEGIIFKRQSTFQFDVVKGRERFLSKYVKYCTDLMDYPTRMLLLTLTPLRLHLLIYVLTLQQICFRH